ncbi:class I SAM-dependent methyltransferase [Yoonia sp. R2331]|uniref:class I SAM-dependent methyltransferase n=1 Tax=Yoonia sp. R2331 TaxID=3237238 RepID=UPI0034E3CD0B
MNALAQKLAAQIAANGPITLADFMAACLFDPTHGYYTTREPFGAGGDFVTAPEISQMFGEMLGLALAQSWLDQGAPAPVTLAELGPGRGTLMADILRATRGVPGFHDAVQVHLVEASPRLRALQADAVPQARFADTLADLPDAPLLLVANEFFDALPIRQFTRAGDGWAETLVGVAEGALHLGRSAAAPRAFLTARLADTAEGDVIEHCPGLPTMIAEIDARIADRGGAALIVDYGDWVSQGDTFQAMRQHKLTDVLADPGQADLTAHVDFSAIAGAVSRSHHSRLTPQGVFLERLGITARAQALAAQMQGAALDEHIAAHRRLTHPGEMGDLFKVMGLWPHGAAPIPGLNA